MSFPSVSLLVLIFSSSVLPERNPSRRETNPDPLPQFEFTRTVYNASVPENSMGSTLVLPNEKMGIWNEGGRVKLEIVEGDPLKLFRVEEKQVGIFCFLILRVNNNERSLNREFKDLYKLRVKGTLFNVVPLSNGSVGSREPLSPMLSKEESLGLLDRLDPSSNAVPDEGRESEKRIQNDDSISRTSKVVREAGSGGEIVQNDPNGSLRLLEISRLHHYLDLDSPTTTEKESFSRNLQSGSSYGGKSRSTRPSILKSKSSKERNPGGRKSKALRRTFRDERRSKTRNKTKSGEKRKNRKEKQIVSSSQSIVPIPINAQPTTTTVRPKLAKIPLKILTTSPPKVKVKLVPVAVTECIIFIQILDQPDNGPLFEQRTYDMSVLEDIPVLSKIAKIVAVDADIGRNQEIYYSLAEWNSHFSVDPILGILSPTRPLLGMVGKRQHIRIQARNRWSRGPAAESMSIVSIRPANRHTPQILITRPPQVETRPYGVIYAFVSVRDNDNGGNGLVDVTIKEGDPNGVFVIIPASSRNEFYVVMLPVVARSLHFKGAKTNTFNLTLRAEDGGNPPKFSEKELRLKVRQSPGSNRIASSFVLFDKDLYEVEISESSPPQTVVFRFPRPDPKVTLSISSGNEGEEFRLEKSGVLYTSKWLDFERKSTFTLTVDSLDLRPVRYDQIRRHRSAVKIVVKLIDENKFYPTFDLMGGNRTEVFFGENEPMGTLVTRVHARDYDQGENGYVTYSMANLNQLPFSIDHFTGEVRSTEVLDYETSRRNYVAKIRATDWGLPFRRESEMKLQISLLPVNDNRPLFIYSNCVSVIDRRINFETEFGRVMALDFDHDVVTYKIVHGNSDSCFSIDSTGTLRVMCDLRDFRISKRVLNLTAGDGEYYSDVMSIKIELRDSLRTNFNKSDPPRIGIKLYSTSHSVFECQDTGVQGRYDRMAALSEENNKMDETDLDGNDGFPTLPSHYTENTQPQFLDFPNEIRVNESVAVGRRVVKLKAVDRDKGYNAFLKFVISGGDENHGAWDIISVETTSWSGVTVQEAFLVVARPLDREEFPFYTLNISVFDQGKPPRSMSKLLPIKILDENDNAPEFFKPAMKIRIREGNELVGETIAQVRADDEDEEGSPNSMITYRLPNETFHNFSIDGRNGKVRLRGELDREKVDRYEILILAEDNGQPRKSSKMVLTIEVEDRNDESPKFLSVGSNESGGGLGKGRLVNVREDWPLYSVVTRVVAEDPDLGDGGLVRYSLSGARGDFVLDEISGVLRINRKLDYQRTSMYNLTIRARDLGTPSHVAETFLIVEIYDVQESQPRLSFPELVIVANVSESAPVGSLVKELVPSPLLQGGLYFSLEGPSQFLFSIDNKGNVRTLYEMDYETQSHWHYLTVLVQSSLDMTNVASCFLVIEILNENDCVPLTSEPMYHGWVEENQAPGVPVLQLQGFDCDNLAEELRFTLRSPSSYFRIDSKSGQILTTAPLDRESQSIHYLDVILSDNGTPPLNSTTKVRISVADVNDHVPIVLQFSSGSVYDIPELTPERQEQDDEADGGGDESENLVTVENEENENLKWSDWRMMDVKEEMAMAEGWRKIFRVVGSDPDAGLNGTIQYRLKYRVSTGTELRREDEVYSIHPQSGEIYTSAASLSSETILKFVIEVADNGGAASGSRSETELTLRVKSVERAKGSRPPILSIAPAQQITVTTREKPGYTVETFEATDPDGDKLWYELVSGDPEQYFILFPDSRNLIVARTVPNPTLFKLNVSVSDGFNYVFTQLLVKVIESNEDAAPLIWEQQNYTVGISESTPPYSVVTTMRLNETSRKHSNTVPLYGFHNAQDSRSFRLFSIDSVSGIIRTAGGERVDRESIPLHIITVKARAREMYTFTRLIIHILDENDKAPVFGSYSQTEVRIPETMAVGSLITQVLAFDGDTGENGVLTYAIIYGNIGNTFEMDGRTGRIFLRRQLSIPPTEASVEYQLTVRATDGGTPPLSATTSVNILVSLPSDNDFLSLRCDNGEEEERRRDLPCTCAVHLKENSRPGTYITTFHVLNSLAGISFEIEDYRNNVFWIDPSTGVLLVGTGNSLDREVKAVYDFIIKATNAQGVSATCRMKILLDDENDSVPMFTNQLYYEGFIPEDAPLGTLVLEEHSQKSREAGEVVERNALVFRSVDYDIGRNALVTYSFVEDEEMRTIFYMDPSSGALLLVTSLDYEKRKVYNFQVRACDFQFCDPSPANVTVRVENVNDQEPIVLSATVELFLPTADGVLVHSLQASDPDGDELTFSLLNSLEAYVIEPKTGRIYVRHEEKVTPGNIGLEISVSDGKFTKTAMVLVGVSFLQENPNFKFTNLTFQTTFVENSTKIGKLISLPVSGTHLNENLQFTVLNPSIYFGIMRTSGVVVTTGQKLDREHQSQHKLLVEVRGEEETRVSRCFVEISVTDVNDNAPYFLNLPYIAVVMVNSKIGELVLHIKAEDIDANENGVVRFELVRSPAGDIYELNKATGQIFLRRKPETIAHHELVVKAYDLGLPSLQTETQVQIKVVNQDQPVFEHQFYETWVPESSPIQSTVLSITARSRDPIFFSIDGGNELDLFGIDYQTGTIFVNAPLDFEMTPIHLLKVKATDLVSSSWSSTMVQINLKDSNDEIPKPDKSTFVFHVAEGYMPPKGILGKIVTTDKDEGVNALLSFEIEPTAGWRRSTLRSPRSVDPDTTLSQDEDSSEEGMMSEDATSNNRSVDITQIFTITSNDGFVILKQILDYEYAHEYYFSVIVRDSGIPSLSATARVIINVVNINDNAPYFSKPLYNARLSEDAPKGHTVAKVSAMDLDDLDTLRYAIMGEYYKQNVFEIEKSSGIITLIQPQVLQSELRFTLNVSVTDGVFTSYARLQIFIQPKNHVVPAFDLSIYEVLAPENSPEGFLVTTLTAKDNDRGMFGEIFYSFSDMDEPNLFEIDERNGQVRLTSLPDLSLDQEYKESHTFQVLAQDGGKWIGYTKLVIKVEKRKSSPIFPVSEYRVTIPANKMRSKNPILQTKVVDSDTEFGIRYSIEDLPNENLTNKRDSKFFEINGENGDLRFKLNQEDLAQIGTISVRTDFHFWVRADDGELHSTVPVTVVVLPDSEPSPEIHPHNATFFLKEDASVGSIVTTFRVSNIDSPKYRVVSSNEDLFTVDLTGNLVLSARLDQDEEDKHTVVVWAQSSGRENVATSQVTIRVLAAFSNKPKFNQPEYRLSVAEDFPEGSLVFTARAVDSDRGGNIKERYELKSDDPDTDLFHFGINQEHGWITLLNRLDYEKHKQHVLRVIAFDSDNPAVTSGTTVIINVLNVDDEPTLFDSGVYYTEVREDIAENSVIKILRTVDLDDENGNTTITSKYLDFYIVDGDPNSHFKINNKAEISLWRKLDAEIQDRFELSVLATDGRTIDRTNVTIKIIDVNDNVPVCPTPEIQQTLSEAAPNTTYVTVVEAYDPDKNSRSPLFRLSGPGSENFRIDPESGILSVRGVSLDRETTPIYQLTVHATDREEPTSECRIRVRITLLDENDNAPVWRYTSGIDDESMFYKFSLKEDSLTGTFVGKVKAQDSDLGQNSRISYTLVSVVTKGGETAKDQFQIERRSGVISLLRPLDRELIAEYNLTVLAVDAGSPPLSVTVPVIVQVLDINDNPPEFSAGSYSVAVSESTAVSTEVIRVWATSKDEGVNAEVKYDIVGGNGYFHWGVDPETGAIFSNGTLDYERIREYILTVRARDGLPDNQLASQSTVNISIIDENDNAPQFSQESYSVSVPEDLPVSSSVIQISAADLDSGMNSEIIYQLGYGDPMNSFRIQSSTGIISVASVLDREMIPYYTLEIIATDKGSPPKSTSCLVQIQILDVNDSPPLFSKENYTAIVQEDRLIGFKVITFEVGDADSPPNSTPFSWDLKSMGEEGNQEPLPFTVSDGGSLVVAGKLNFLRKKIYKLQVTVFDNGTPPLESKANVTIQVVDKSQWPPVISSLGVTAVTLGDTYPPGILGVCHASDFDSFDVLTYSLLTTKSSSFFTIDPLNGTLYNLIPLREGTYELGVVVSDGRWSARNDAYVKVISLSRPFPDIPAEQLYPKVARTTNSEKSQLTRNAKEMKNFILMSISGHDRQSLLNRMSAFKNVVKQAVSVEAMTKNSYEVIILSVQTNLNVKRPEDGDENSQSARRRREAPVSAVDVLLSAKKINDGKFMPTDQLVHQLKFALPQIEGILRAKVTQITSNICTNSSCDRGTCRTIAIFEGTQSLITTETLSLITPNHNLETICSCPVGYGGLKCETVVNACAYSECSEGLVCVPDESPLGFACLCAKLSCSSGKACDHQCSQQAVSFSGTSLLSYNVGQSLERELSISFRIKTLYTSGTLLFSMGEFDYAILEINQGLVQFSWDLGTGKEVLTVTSISVSDNRWHRIVLQLRDSYAILRVNERSTQRQKSHGPARILHTNGIFHIGSKLIGPHSSPIDSQIPSQGFIGCMKDLRFGFISEATAKSDDFFQTQTQEVKHYINSTPGRTRLVGDSIGEETNPETKEHKTEEESQADRTASRMNILPLHVAHLESSEFNLIFSRNVSFSCAKVIHFVEACRSLPCKNGGTCYADSTPNGYTCKCNPRFHGLNCEIDLEPCASSPCLNNGKCRPTSTEISFSPSLSLSEHSEAQFYCQCVDDGTHGSRCQSGKYCKNSESLGESEACNHRGECEDGPSGPICWCETGYTGPRCQFDFDECKEGGEKVCGPGSKCVNFLGGFRCLCPSNASGVYCQKVLTTPSIVTNDYQMIVLIFVIVLSLLALLFILLCVRRCCSKRRRHRASNSIPLTTSQNKDQDNRINRDNRDQMMRNRDSKISNLEVRPVSAGSEIFQMERVPLDGVKNYVQTGDEPDKPQFINNLMKPTAGEKKRSGQTSWDTNRDDFPKIQNFSALAADMKGEISWGTKGSKPNSPDSGDVGQGYQWDGYHGDPHAHPANISPIRTLPPPPDIPDSVSIVSHDSNNGIQTINLSLLPPITDLGGLTEGGSFDDSDGGAVGTSDENKWPIPHPDAYLLPHNRYAEDDQSARPIVLRNRYQDKPGGGSQHYKEPPQLPRQVNEDEINENCSLLCGTPFPAQAPSMTKGIDPPPSDTKSGTNSPRKRFSSSSIFPMKPSGRSSSTNKQNYSKTTHVTEV